MAVRFIIGRAGSGKTARCLAEIHQRIREDPIAGPRLLLLVPEQASLQMERAILQPDKGQSCAGVHRAEVLSFRRLAHRVIQSIPGLKNLAMTEQARVMVLRHLLSELRDKFLYYRRVAGAGAGHAKIGGLVNRISASIVELMEESVAPQDLLALGGSDLDNSKEPGVGAARAKCHDLGLIYQAYLEYLGPDKLDPTQHLQVARDHLARCDWLSNIELWVDGFASFSMQELLTLEKLVQCSQEVSITIMMDPHLADLSGVSGTADDSRARLFARTLRTYRQMIGRFKKIGLSVADPILFSQAEQKRFAPGSSLETLERRLFAEDSASEAVESQSVANLEVVELSSRRAEVDYAVCRVCEWIRSSETNYRYRDIAIIARNIDTYHSLLSESLTARGVPFFMDRRRPTGHHPLVELIRAGAALMTESMSFDSIKRLLDTGLIGMSDDARDELENYLLAHGLSGIDAWCRGDWTYAVRSSRRARPKDARGHDDPGQLLDRINRHRRKVIEAVNPWIDGASSDARLTGSDWVERTLRWIETLRVSNTLQRWAHQCEEDGELDEADEHRQIWAEVHSFLDDANFALGQQELSTDDWADVLDVGLSHLTLGLVPPTVDQVLVGSIERSRHPDIKAAVIIGFNDGEFPARITEDPILNDDDRSLLETAGIRLRPSARDRARDETMLAYVALTRASESLVITYASSDNDHKPLRASPYVKDLQAVFADLDVLSIQDPYETGAMGDVVTSGDLIQRLTHEYQVRGRVHEGDSTSSALWNHLYETVRANLAQDKKSRWSMRSLDEQDDQRVAPEIMAKLYPGSLQSSVSRLESFAKCPFKHFAEYTLGLQEREHATLRAVDVGRLHHNMLEDFIGSMVQQKNDFASLDDADLAESLDQSRSRVVAHLPDDAKWSDSRTKYRLQRSARDLSRVLQAQVSRSVGTDVRPWAVELSFGLEGQGSLQALELRTKFDRSVLLRGIIDRVDLVERAGEQLGLVIDYKSARSKKLIAAEVYHGISLQLLTYMLVLGEARTSPKSKPIRPIGALYVSLAPRYATADHPDHVQPRELYPIGTQRPRGLLDGDCVGALEPATQEGWFQHYTVYRKKDGSLGNPNSSDAADPASFAAMLAHTRRKLEELADGVFDGLVAVSPYRLKSFSPCTWCQMSPVCRFEMGLSQVRFLESMRQVDVWDRMKERTA